VCADVFRSVLAKHRHQPIAHDLHDPAALLEDRRAGFAKVAAEELGDFRHGQALGYRGEAADVGEQDGLRDHATGHAGDIRFFLDLRLAALELPFVALAQLVLLRQRPAGHQAAQAPAFVQRRADRFDQLKRAQRLRKKVVRAQPHPAAHAVVIGKRGDQDERQPRGGRIRPQRIENPKAVHAWHLHVAKHDIGCPVADFRETRVAVGGGLDAKAGATEHV